MRTFTLRFGSTGRCQVTTELDEEEPRREPIGSYWLTFAEAVGLLGDLAQAMYDAYDADAGGA